MALLEIVGLEAGYDHLQVLHGIDVEVGDGEVVALLGTNGAGKSTLLRAVAGLLPPTAGSVIFDGTDITAWRADAIVRRGLVLVEGGRAIFPSLSVDDNLRLGAYPILTRDRAGAEQRVARALGVFPLLEAVRRRPAGTLSGGEQQMVALARALVAQPRLLLIDELSLGLAPVVLQQLVGVVEQIASDGVSVLLVEQSLNIAMTLASRAYFLEKGEVRFSGPPGDLVDRGDLVRSVFFGGEAAARR